MTDPALQMIIERLLWPPPRVRSEAARSIAKLIRSGDLGAADALVEWMGNRSLESEAAIALNLIYAFDLSEYFTVEQLRAKLTAPSLLSSWLLEMAYPEVGSSPANYMYAPGHRPSLPERQIAWFHRYRKWAVAPLFSLKLAQLEADFGLPYTRRWEHEWQWLQLDHKAPAAEYPWMFSEGDRSRRGQFDQRQREIYLSAYLRTLAFGVQHWGLHEKIANYLVRDALIFNRDLADLEPIERPIWSLGLASKGPTNPAQIARELLKAAKADLKSEDRLVRLHATDESDDGTLDIRAELVACRANLLQLPANAEENQFWVVEREQGGVAGNPKSEGSFDLDQPTLLACGLHPPHVGRTHSDIAFNIRLAAPQLLSEPINVVCADREVRLSASGKIQSRWVHWYSEWDTTLPTTLGTCLNSITTVSAAAFEALRTRENPHFAWLVRITSGTREASYKEMEERVEAFWEPHGA